MKKGVNYNIGLDIGIASVGWAVTDCNCKLLKKGKQNLWGSRLFDEAETAKKTRNLRSTRRRYNKRRERIRLLREAMSDMVLSVDESFFHRLDASTFLDKEDKQQILGKDYKANYNIFSGGDYTDKDFYRDYKTIYHLRDRLIYNEEKADPRLIYLALHHIVKYRGNFLHEGQKFDFNSTNINEDLEQLIIDIFEINNKSVIESYNSEEFLNILTNKTISKKTKVGKCVESIKDKEINKILKELFNGIIGLSCNLNNLFSSVVLDLTDKNKSIKFSDSNIDETLGNLEEVLEDTYIDVIVRMKGIYSLILVNDIIKDGKPKSPISSTMIKKYDNHKEELNELKDILKNYDKKIYDEVFKNKGAKVKNYHNYINRSKDTPKDKFYIFLKTKLKGINDDRIKVILDKIDNENYLLKQNDTVNGEFPYQLNLVEMQEIINNQAVYYPDLVDVDLTKILTFRIPYYYGPLDGNEEHGWLIKKEDKNERITPFNHEDVVDVDETAKRFIERMTNYCTYLRDKDVMPKNSLVCSKYEVLSELNKIRVNNRLISTDTKQKIYNDLFTKKKSITADDLKKWYQKEQIEPNNDELVFKGFQRDNSFASSLKPWIDFTKIFGDINDSNFQLIEEIIKDITIFEDKKILKRRLKNIHKLSEDKVEKILRLKYKGWSRLSKELIMDIRCDNRFGSSANILDVMYESNMVLMEIINDTKLGYDKELEKYNDTKELDKITYEDIKELAGSPAIKKGIWQSVKIVEELVNYMGRDPRNIFIEFSRDERKKERNLSQINQLKKIYESLDLKTVKDKEVNNELKSHDDKKKLDFEKLYLYYTQMGRCMYTNDELDYDSLSTYQVDHIIPQSFVTDDSLDNKVLVKSKENQRKLDELVVPSDIRKRMRTRWEYLHKHKLISDSKYNRLIREEYNDKIKEKFINRQLVETRQIIKNVSNLLNKCYGNTNIVAIRADLTHQFRIKHDIYKIRNYNSYHHAHDAYITCVIGEYINKRFANYNSLFIYDQYLRKAKESRSIHEKSGLIINTMNYDWVDNFTGEVIWSKDNIKDIVKCFDYKDCFVTKKLEEMSGKFFDENISSKYIDPKNKKSKNQFPIAVNKYRTDIKKYGGYSNVKCTIYAINAIKNDKKSSLYRNVVGIPLVYKNKSCEFKEKFIFNKYGLKKINKIKEIKVNQLIEMDGTFYRIRSINELANGQELLLSKKDYKVLSKLDYAFKNNDYGNINGRQVDDLYSILVEKIDKYYNFDNVIKHLKEKENEFKTLALYDKYLFIQRLLDLTNVSPGQVNLKIGSFKVCNDPVRLKDRALNLDKITFIHQSVTGIYVKKEKL